MAGASPTIQFYHLLTTPLERALPKLMEKALSAGFSVAILAHSEAQVEHLNQWLWTYDPGSFLPHGSTEDGHGEAQPIFLSTSTDTPNNARILTVLNGQPVDKPERFERILDIFDGNDSNAVEQARARWTHYKGCDYPIAYMRQNDTGGWDQKVIA